jgi:hypothetical protein
MPAREELLQPVKARTQVPEARVRRPDGNLEGLGLRRRTGDMTTRLIPRSLSVIAVAAAVQLLAAPASASETDLLGAAPAGENLYCVTVTVTNPDGTTLVRGPQVCVPAP